MLPAHATAWLSGGRSAITPLMAPGGIEPPRAASKAAALSAELRGRALRSVARSSDRDGGAELLLEVREIRLRVDRRAGRPPQQLLGRVLAALGVDVRAEPVAERRELAAPDLPFEIAELVGRLLPDLDGHHRAEEVRREVADQAR